MNLPTLSPNWPNIIVLFIALAAVAGVGYESWRVVATESQAGAASLSSQAMATATPLPSLKLNNAHQRQGAQIQTDPSALGKTNPFQ